MKKILNKLDWVWLIRMAMAGIFVWVGISYQDWIPAIFGLFWMAVASYAALKKTGCGYDTYCVDFRKKEYRQQSTDEISFTEIK